MRSSSVLACGLISLVLAACSDKETGADGGRTLDAAEAADAGVVADAGVIADSGVIPDSGVLADAGVIADSGNVADSGAPLGAAPRAVEVAQATSIPACTLYVDAANSGTANGTAANPYATMTAAIAAAANDAIICVAEGTYRESLAPAEKYFTLAGGFQSGGNFAVRDSARYVSKALGDGMSIFFKIGDVVAPMEGQLTAVDGFEITGYSQAVVRDFYVPQRFDLTNNFIHDNTCAMPGLIGAGFAMSNISGTISGNVIARNTCSRGGAGALVDETNNNSVTITRNWIDSNIGDEPGSSHGGGLYLEVHELTITANAFTGNRVDGWGGGLYVGAAIPSITSTARLSWNVYRDNRATDVGGGFFCDDSAHCSSDHDVFEKNCGGNIFLDNGVDPTIADFDHLTNYQALSNDCSAPGAGVVITKNDVAADAYSFTNSIFWGNAQDSDLVGACNVDCASVTVNVTYSNVQTSVLNVGAAAIAFTFGAGNISPVDPLFADPAAHDFHLRSTHGHWTPGGYVNDVADSPALAAGDPVGSTSDNPDRAGDRTELGAYGNSFEASYVR